MTTSRFSVTTLPVGHGEVPGPELFWMSRWDEWLPLTFQVVLLRGRGVTALVNTGPARDLGPMNAQWESFLGPRAAMRREEGEFVLDQLARVGVAPEDVTHVVLTPLQLYTISNVLAFERAEICIAKRGWVHFHTTKHHPHDDRASCIPDEILVRLVTDRWADVRLLEDEDEIVPGLRTWWAGAHHRASIVVEADTAQGVVAVSDAFFWRENVERDHPIGINESIAEALACHARVRRTADVVLPLYDPKNLERFPDGRVA